MSYHNISEIINGAIEAESLGGASICVIKDGEVKILEGYGTDKADSIYKCYSMTKLFTSVVAFTLVEDGTIALDDPVAKYFPEFENHLVYNAEGGVEVEKTTLTIQHLLNMTSGIPYPFPVTDAQKRLGMLEADEFARAKAGIPFTTRSACAAMAQVPGDFEPGKGWEYGAGADLLGGVMEVATGKTLDVLYEERLFGPLGMSDSGWYVPVEKAGRMAAAWHRNGFGRVERAEQPLRTRKGDDVISFQALSNMVDVEPACFLGGGGGCYSTASDYARMLQMLLNGGELDGVRILKQETVEFMHTPQLDEAQYTAKERDMVGSGVPGYSYSNLLRILVEPEKAQALGVNGHAGEYGWDGAGGNFCLVDPAINLVAVFHMQNFEGPEPILRRRLYKAIVAED